MPLKPTLTPVSFEALEGWGADDFTGFAAAFEKSCARISKQDPAQNFGPLPQAGRFADWQELCAAFTQNGHKNLKAFFEQNFIPYAVSADGEYQGLFTGYYEASLRGARQRGGVYQTPLHLRPDDLVMVDLGAFREELKGQRIAGRVVEGNLRPYETRAQIVSGAWPHSQEVLIWVDDPVDAFFVQVQGSGLVQMAEGGVMRIGYAGQNGHPYYAIGRELIKRGELTKDTVSMQSIRAWLEANPRDAAALMNTNKSYVFFREIDGEGPIGGEGVALTAERSLAIDRSLLPYGMPVWVDIAHPEAGQAALRRLMVAQDTGGAIRGPVRGDFFWGYGPDAEHKAGLMKSQGRYWMLLPKTAAP